MGTFLLNTFGLIVFVVVACFVTAITAIRFFKSFAVYDDCKCKSDKLRITTTGAIARLYWWYPVIHFPLVGLLILIGFKITNEIGSANAAWKYLAVYFIEYFLLLGFSRRHRKFLFGEINYFCPQCCATYETLFENDKSYNEWLIRKLSLSTDSSLKNSIEQFVKLEHRNETLSEVVSRILNERSYIDVVMEVSRSNKVSVEEAVQTYITAINSIDNARVNITGHAQSSGILLKDDLPSLAWHAVRVKTQKFLSGQSIHIDSIIFLYNDKLIVNREDLTIEMEKTKSVSSVALCYLTSITPTNSKINRLMAKGGVLDIDVENYHYQGPRSCASEWLPPGTLFSHGNSLVTANKGQI